MRIYDLWPGLKQRYLNTKMPKRWNIYEERIIESEKASFTPLIFTTSGGMGPESNVFYKRIAEKTAARKNDSYSLVMNYFRTRLRFAILRSTLIGIRGVRVRKNRNLNDISLDNVSINIMPVVDTYECR